jgi:hypothetical protein
MSEYDVVISLQFLHSNWDSRALSKAASCNNGGPLVATADSIVPSLRIPSTTVTSPVMCATREIGGYIGGDNLVRITSACFPSAGPESCAEELATNTDKSAANKVRIVNRQRRFIWQILYLLKRQNYLPVNLRDDAFERH